MAAVTVAHFWVETPIRLDPGVHLLLSIVTLAGELYPNNAKKDFIIKTHSTIRNN